MKLNRNNIFVPISEGNKLHMLRLQSQPSSLNPVLMLHGAIENSRIFYSNSNDYGFGCLLAKRGFDVFAADLRGRGLSTPPISRRSTFGQFEAINEDLPALVKAVKSKNDKRLVIVCHSWGGVLLFSSIARSLIDSKSIACVVCFGTKRRVLVQNPEKWLKVDLFWNLSARFLVNLFGYLPAKEFRIGSDNESKLSWKECNDWVRRDSGWIEKDGFDYGKAIKDVVVPPTLMVMADRDYSLGHPKDVRLFADEIGEGKCEFKTLHGFGHIDMLTSKKSVHHLESIGEWIEKHV